MPGATTARLVFFDAAIAGKLFMMPQTVPNRPTNGAVEPTVARKPIKRSTPVHLAPDGDVHHALDALLQAGAHARRAEQPLRGAAPPFAHRGGEHRAPSGRPAACRPGRTDRRASRPTRSVSSKLARLLAARRSRSDLVEDDRPATRTRRASRISMTSLTMLSDCRNRPNIDRLWAVAAGKRRGL